MVSNQRANMNTLEKLNTTLENGGASTEEALKFFDKLESVNLEFMIGRWQGYEFPTNHPMDGLLKASGWYGKEFVDAEQVHPLLFSDGNNSIRTYAKTLYIAHDNFDELHYIHVRSPNYFMQKTLVFQVK